MKGAMAFFMTYILGLVFLPFFLVSYWLWLLSLHCPCVWCCLPLTMSDSCIFLLFSPRSCVGRIWSAFFFFYRFAKFASRFVFLSRLLVLFFIFYFIFWRIPFLFCFYFILLFVSPSNGHLFLFCLLFIIVFLLRKPGVVCIPGFFPPPLHSALQSRRTISLITENVILIWLISEFCCSCAF